AAISTTPAVPMVRVPWNEPILTAKLGARSFGPNRALLYGGADYWQHANDEVLVFAMVETREAVKNLDESVSVEGLDGVYVGPSDLSLSMGKTPTLDPQDPEVLAAIKAICAGTRKRGKIAGVHTDGAKTAIRRFGEGYQLCTILSDARLMANAAAAARREARGQMAQAGAKTYWCARPYKAENGIWCVATNAAHADTGDQMAPFEA